MPAKPFVTETREFAKKGDAHAFFSAMLNRYRVGSRVSNEDARDLVALLKCHTEYVSKFGGGISHFEVMRSVNGPTNCFQIVRTDGSRDDFSFKHCITPKPD